MASPNLTREQAAQRARTVAVTRYTLDLDLTDGAGAPGTVYHAVPQQQTVQMIVRVYL